MEDQAHNIADLVTGIVLLLLVAALTTMLSKRIEKLPLTIALVVVGIAIAAFTEHISILGTLSNFSLTPELVLFVFIPTLIFESAFNLDARQVGRNIWPILTMAVPGLLLSTVIIGLIISTFTTFGFMVALLLGAILSATDPVAVISIFKQLGVPERLTILVEGESLFNDATSLVLATLLIGIVSAGSFSSGVVLDGIAEFFVVFLGGVLVGWLLAVVVGYTLGSIESDTAIEITFTTILAYFSFVIAEHVFHVSGIMAVVAAGLTIGSWGKSKISPSTSEFMEHFWEYLAYVANALIFLMVGMQIDLPVLWQSIDLIAFVVVAMLVSRAVVIFGLIPVIGKLPGSEPIEPGFQKVMYWGGLRGAIALAIVLSLPDTFEYKDTLVAVVMGAVLFTLIVQGLSIEKLVKLLELDKLSVPDQLAKLEGDKHAREEGMARLDSLVQGGLFSQRVADNLRERCERNLADLNEEIESLHAQTSTGERLQILGMRCLAREKARYYELFRQGLINEWAFRELDHTIDVQLDEVRHGGQLPRADLKVPISKSLSIAIMRGLEWVPGCHAIVERFRTLHIIRDYDVGWGRYRGAKSVLSSLDDLAGDSEASRDLVEQIRSVYEHILELNKTQIDAVAEQYPEFVEAMQEQLGQRLLLIAEHESVEHAAGLGMLQEGIADTILKDQAERIRQLKKDDVSASLEIGVNELLSKVPVFKGMTEEEFEDIGTYLRPRTVPRGTAIIKQGQEGGSMFLIARGIANVFIEEEGETHQVASLYAGDFFGEAALLHGQPRNATAMAVTPCSLYELKRVDLDRICQRYPSIRKTVEEVDRERVQSNTLTGYKRT